MENPLLDGLTLCGETRFSQQQNARNLCVTSARPVPTEPCGLTLALSMKIYSQIRSDRNWRFLCDVIVDGRFVEQQKDLTLPFRGSRNQRLVDVKASIQAGYTVSLT